MRNYGGGGGRVPITPPPEWLRSTETSGDRVKRRVENSAVLDEADFFSVLEYRTLEDTFTCPTYTGPTTKNRNNNEPPERRVKRKKYCTTIYAPKKNWNN